MITRLILLDRDGVVNHDSPDYIKTPEEWVAIPGSIQAISDLKASGRLVAICTNQAGVARGKLSLAQLQAIHHKMKAALADSGAELDGLIFCPHHPEEGCSCRKPRPGMLLKMMAQLDVAPDQTVYAGDSIRDAEAATAAGCHFVLVRTGNGKDAESTLRRRGLTEVYDDLADFVASLAETGV